MDEAKVGRELVMVDPVKLMERLALQFPREGHSNRLLMANMWVDPACLIPTKDNARNPSPADEKVIALGRSMSVVQLNSVQARPHPTDIGLFDLRAGCRRRAGAISAGIPIRVDLYDWDDETAFAVTMAENHDREDLTILEEARLCATCLERYTVEEAADLLGHSAAWIRRRAALSRLTAEAQACGSPEWTISYWETLALLEPEAQAEVALQVSGYHLGVDGVSLSDLRRLCRSHTRPLGTERLWPMEFPFPSKPCAECAKRKGAIGYLPGLGTEEGGDECLDKGCYEKRLRAWLESRVLALREEAGEALPVLADYPSQNLLTVPGVMKNAHSWEYAEEQSAYRSEPVRLLVVDVEGPVRIETRYVAKRSGQAGSGGEGEEAGPSADEKRRWKAVKKAVTALQEDLSKAEKGEEGPIRLGLMQKTWQGRCKHPVVDLDIVLVAIACFGQSHHADRREWHKGKGTSAKPCFGLLVGQKDVSRWQPLELLGKATSQEKEREVLAEATTHLFQGLCGTLSSRLHIETLKADADKALAEARAVCEFLGLDWQGQYAEPAGLEG